MYIFDDFIDMGLEETECNTWLSDAHREVAMTVCLANPVVTDLDTLSNNIAIINKIHQDQIKSITYDDLVELGCRI